MTLRRVLERAIARALIACSLVAVLFTFVAHDVAIPGVWTPPEHTVDFDRPSIPERMAAEHGCWTEGDHGLPGHAVITRDAHRGPEYVGPRLTGLALEQAVGGIDHGLRVHAFCP